MSISHGFLLGLENDGLWHRIVNSVLYFILRKFICRLVDFEYDKTFLKSMVSDFFHFRLSVFTVDENEF